MQTLNELFEQGLKGMYYTEKAILTALPKMAGKASSSALSDALNDHCEETKGQLMRLEQLFKDINVRPEEKKCAGIDGLIAEAEQMMAECENEAVCDAVITAAAQAVEHYEMAQYGALISWAEKMDMQDAMDVLRETLEEEKRADAMLTDMAESEVNLDIPGGEDSAERDNVRA